MAETAALHGLNCPRCGGMVTIPEGQALVICPFCELRSVVSGVQGVRRYQVPNRIDRAAAVQAYQKFVGGNLAIARSVKRLANLNEVMLVHLPFWAVWGRVAGWVFGEERHQAKNSTYYTPKEKRVVEEMGWNQAACEVGEFGVTNINLAGRPLEAFNQDGLHRSGMVFEPVSSDEEALTTAKNFFEKRALEQTGIDRVSQAIVRLLRVRQGLVYYPLWVMRYTYKQRAFQVVVDGFSGEVLYGKAPGNPWFRAVVLVAGMAAGAFIGIDIPMGILSASSGDSHDSLLIPVVIFGVGMGIMYAAYHKFRYGEHYEYRRYQDAAETSGFSLSSGLGSVKNIVNKIERM
jgi:hypothetical protein